MLYPEAPVSCPRFGSEVGTISFEEDGWWWVVWPPGPTSNRYSAARYQPTDLVLEVEQLILDLK